MGPVCTVNVPLQCRRDCLYNKTEHRQVSIALYLQRLLLWLPLAAEFVLVSGSVFLDYSVNKCGLCCAVLTPDVDVDAAFVIFT